MEYGVSEKSNIHSYGPVLLEINGGRRSASVISDHRCKRKFQYFPKIVSQKLREGRLMEVVDERLVGGGGIDEGRR